jgi:hypothetical protein
MVVRSPTGIGAALLLAAQMLSSPAHAAMLRQGELIGFAIHGSLPAAASNFSASVSNAGVNASDSWAADASATSGGELNGPWELPLARYGGMNGALIDSVRIESIGGSGEPSPVPLPPTLWLLVPAVGGLLGLMRRRSPPLAAAAVGGLS